MLADGQIVADRDAGSADEFLDVIGRGVVIRVALEGLVARKLRTALTAFAIAIGVTLIAGTYIFTDTINAHSTRSSQDRARDRRRGHAAPSSTRTTTTARRRCRRLCSASARSPA